MFFSLTTGCHKKSFYCFSTLGTVEVYSLLGTPSLPWSFWALWKLCAQKYQNRPKSNQKVQGQNMPNVPMCQKMPIFLRTSDKSPEVPQSTQNPKSCPANLKPKTLQLHNYRYCVPWKYSWFLRSHFPLEDFLIAVPKNFHQNWRKYRKVANLHDIEEVSIVLGSGVEPLLDAL